MNEIALPDKGTNRHPVDQLAQVRATIKQLQDRESELKAEVSQMMGNRDSLGGDEFIARQTVTERKGAIDEKAMAAAGIKPDAYRKPPVTVYSIRCEPRVMEEA